MKIKRWIIILLLTGCTVLFIAWLFKNGDGEEKWFQENGQGDKWRSRTLFNNPVKEVSMKAKASGRRQRRVHTAEFKARVALSALKEDKTLAQLSAEFEVHANQIVEWRKQLFEGAAGLFGRGKGEPPVDLAPLHAKIGQLALENDFLEGALSKAGWLGANWRSVAK